MMMFRPKYDDKVLTPGDTGVAVDPDSVGDLIEDMVTYAACSSLPTNRRARGINTIGLFPMLEMQGMPQWRMSLATHPKYLKLAGLWNPSTPFAKWIIPCEPDDNEEAEDLRYIVYNAFALQKAGDEYRRIKATSEYVAALRFAHLCDTGLSEGGCIYFRFNGTSWDIVDPNWKQVAWHNGQDVDAILSRCMGVCPSVGLRWLYNWRVELGLQGVESTIALQTDAIGAREAFRLRDVPKGSGRRAALRHWVREHWRQRRESDPSLVRSHLRGAERFTWAGLDCRIVPSSVDALRAASKSVPVWMSQMPADP
jgi:hypothetical protein